LVLDPKSFPALAEAMTQRQAGDRLRLCVEVEVVENLPERFAYDVSEAELEGGGTEKTENAEDTEEGEASPLAASVLGVMGRKKK
jgi:hypothetical protein